MPVFAPGSISMRLYPHEGLEATAILDELEHQAALAANVGFDGVMTSEHHGGFAGYIPNPLQVTGWLLGAMPQTADRDGGISGAWAAPCPMLLPIRPVAMLAEELAWLGARFPGRVGIGVAPGALPVDFTSMDIPFEEAMPRFRAGLPRLVAMLSGMDLTPLAGDAALGACRDDPGRAIPVVSTAMSPAAVRRAAACGAGILFDGATNLARLAELSTAYREAGGDGPRILIRRVWLGDPPRDALARQFATYQSYSPAAAQQHWRDDGFLVHDDPSSLAAELVAALVQSGADSLNLRVHVPGVAPRTAREQIDMLGREVLPAIRAALSANGTRA